MKKLIILFVSFILSNNVFAGFVGAKVKVTGVTCSMCSNSVNKALSSLSFIDKIDVDLENAVFILSFKPGEKVVMDEIRKKVEGAGFSVGELTADFAFDSLQVENDYHYTFENNIYHFVGVKNQYLNKTVSLKFVDKGLTSSKEYKKYSNMTNLKCIKTGKPETCCNKVSAGYSRIYHVTL